MSKNEWNWSDEQLRRAKRVVDKGARISNTTDFYGIPMSTLRSHVHGIIMTRKRDKALVFTAIEDVKLVVYLHEIAN
jgi:predicted deacylase